MADRVIFQVSETRLKRTAFVQSQSKWSRNTNLLADDALLAAVKVQAQRKAKGKKEKAEKNEANPSEWIRKISEIFYESWKISERWLLIIKNSLSKVVDHELLTILDSG